MADLCPLSVFWDFSVFHVKFLLEQMEQSAPLRSNGGILLCLGKEHPVSGSCRWLRSYRSLLKAASYLF